MFIIIFIIGFFILSRFYGTTPKLPSTTKQDTQSFIVDNVCYSLTLPKNNYDLVTGDNSSSDCTYSTKVFFKKSDGSSGILSGESDSKIAFVAVDAVGTKQLDEYVKAFTDSLKKSNQYSTVAAAQKITIDNQPAVKFIATEIGGRQHIIYIAVYKGLDYVFDFNTKTRVTDFTTLADGAMKSLHWK